MRTLDDLIDIYAGLVARRYELATKGDPLNELPRIQARVRSAYVAMRDAAHESKLPTLALCLEIDKRLDKLLPRGDN